MSIQSLRLVLDLNWRTTAIDNNRIALPNITMICLKNQSSCVCHLKKNKKIEISRKSERFTIKLKLPDQVRNWSA